MNRKAAQTLSRSVVVHVGLQGHLTADEFDPKAALAALESGENLEQAIAAVATSAKEDEAMAEGLGRHIADLQSRKSRMENTAQQKRGLCIMAMERADLRNVTHPTATIYTSPTPSKLVVKEEAKIPARFFKTPEPELDRAALTTALQDGEIIEGAEMSNGGVTLTIRSK
jgi:hypothetical protein